MDFLLSSSLPFGLNFFEIFLHLLNLAILLLGIRFLLYKPISKFINKRSDEYKKLEEDKLRMQEEIELWNQSYDKRIKKASEDALEIEKKAKSDAALKSNQILLDAKKEAEKIISDGKDKLEKEKERMKKDMYKTISSLSIDIASEVIGREVNEKDNDKVIDDILNKWQEK